MRDYYEAENSIVLNYVGFLAIQAGALTQESAADPIAVGNKPSGSPGLLPSPELSENDETYFGLRSFWGDDTISDFFIHVAEGTLYRARPLVAELCDKWQHQDIHLPAAGIISVPPETEIDLNRLCQ